jgi:hypothetical protein
MIHASAVKIKHFIPGEKEFEMSTDHLLEGAEHAHASLPDMNFEVKKKWEFQSTIKAITHFLSLFESKKLLALSGNFGMLVHDNKNITQNKYVDLYLYEKGKAVKRTIINPLWVGLKKPQRNRLSNVMMLDINSATQSQLFAMVTGNGADSKWMQSFSLKDKQQNDLYSWEQKEFPRINDISPQEMVLIASNMVNVAKLPPLPITFKADGKSCFFSVSLAGGKTLNPESSSDEDAAKNNWGWLRNVEDMEFEDVGIPYSGKNDGLRISGMQLTMIMAWALSAPVIIHEVSHYIEFTNPNPYRLNQGKHRLSFNEYENIFAGHGASFVSIYARGLIDFYGVKEDDVYDSLEESGLSHFFVKSIKSQDIIKGMDDYVVRLQANK